MAADETEEFEFRARSEREAAAKAPGPSSVPGQNPPAAREARPSVPARVVDHIRSGPEALLSVASSIPAGLAGAGAGAFETLTGGKFGTPEGIREGAKRAGEVSEALTYVPRSEGGRDLLKAGADVFAASKLGGMNPATALPAIPTLPAARATGAKAASTVAGKVDEAVGALTGKETTMPGVGAAETDVARMRRERAADLPVPVKLTKGQAERTFEQQQFERETSKAPKEGLPLRERYADQNAAILQNFDAFLDQTGAQARGLRATGEVVNKAVVEKAAKAKNEINAAYEKARASGDMAEPIAIQPLLDYLEKNAAAEVGGASVLSGMRAGLNQLQKKTPGFVPINDLEELRKTVGALAEKDATNGHYGREAKALIDSLTEGKGGAEYQAARAMRYKYANEFENVGVIDRLLSTKPGSKDRAVAYEDVFAHSILKGSLDDVRAVRKTLQTAGPEGQQAWKDLQGQLVQHMKDEITKNVATDIRGNKVVSAANLEKLVMELDRDGKLEFIFGKQGAQKIRDVNDIAKDVFTAPPGSVNTSNTASILIGLLDTAVSGVTGLPLPIGTAVNYGVKQAKSRSLSKKVSSALNEDAFPVIP